VKRARSLLFVPGHKDSWVPKAVQSGADALILDLEDSVPLGEKSAARNVVATSIDWLQQHAPDVAVFVRPNALDTGLAGSDLEAVTRPGLDGFVLPKVDGPRDILHFEGLVDHFEHANGVERGAVHFIPSLESARAYLNCEAILASTERVHTLFAGVAEDADVARSLGFQFTPEGSETLYLRSKALLAMRGAGVRFPLVGVWQDIHDSDGAAGFARAQRQLGYSGMVVIHPSHVPIANGAFSLSQSEARYYQGVVEAFDAALESGSAAATYEGQHIDYAHAKTARELLRDHGLLG
jgi:citrate lyase subunit beta/citryl-CoA lyase